MTIWAPELAAGGEGRLLWDARVTRSYASYHGYIPEPRRLADRAALGLTHRSSEEDSITADYQFTRAEDPAQFDERNVLVFGDARTQRGRGRWTVGRTEGDVRYREWSYADPSLADGRSRTARLTVLPLESPTTAWSVSYGRQELDLLDRGLVANVVTTGFRRRHSVGLSSAVEIGAAEVRHDTGTIESWRGAGSVAVSYRGGAPGRLSTLRLRGGRDVTWYGDVEIGRSWSEWRGVARWERRVDVEGGVYRDPTVTRRASAELRRLVRGDLSVGLEGSLGVTRPLRGRPGRDFEVDRAGVFVETPLRAWLMARARYDFLRQEELGRGSAQTFRRNRIALALAFAPPHE